jgi:nitroreductase
MEAAFRMGAATPNEVRKVFGWEPLDQEGMDTPYAPVSMMPVGEDPVEPNAEPNAPDEGEEDPEDDGDDE